MSLDLVKTIVKVLDEKKAQDIEVIKIGELTSLADYIIICTGTSSTQIKSLAGEIEAKVEKEVKIHHKEGVSTATWILLDYVDVIVNIFHNETRDFYKLDKLWVDGEKLDIAGLLAGEG
jgi:ribosome-associated protein